VPTSTHGRLACPCGYVCRGFQLRNGHKACWFDCHGRFLPIDHEFRKQANAFRKNTKENRAQPSNVVSMQSMAREMARLHRANEMLQQENRAN
jgi:hypothetical protein